MKKSESEGTSKLIIHVFAFFIFFSFLQNSLGFSSIPPSIISNMRLKKRLFTGILVPFLGLAGCSEPEQAQPAQQQLYFDVPGFVQKQVAALTAANAGFQKSLQLQGEKPETTSQQKVNWAEELQYFQEANLNKKALAGAYLISETELKNGTQTVYSRNPDVAAPIKMLEVISGNQGEVKVLRVLYEEENALFYSRETRELIFGQNNLLSSFVVSGVQKVILSDSLQYQVNTIVSNSR